MAEGGGEGTLSPLAMADLGACEGREEGVGGGRGRRGVGLVAHHLRFAAQVREGVSAALEAELWGMCKAGAGRPQRTLSRGQRHGRLMRRGEAVAASACVHGRQCSCAGDESKACVPLRQSSDALQ